MNHVTFDNRKDEAIVIKRRRKLELKGRIAEARITVRGHMMDFNREATRWHGVYLNSELQFSAQNNLTLERSRRAKNRV